MEVYDQHPESCSQDKDVRTQLWINHNHRGDQIRINRSRTENHTYGQ